MKGKRAKGGYELNQSPFYKLASRKKLADLLRITPARLKSLASSDGNYSEWDEVTPKGKIRHIESPHRTLKKVQGRTATLLARIAAPIYLHCPVKSRSYITNADAHKESDVLHTLDVGDYFSSTPSYRIFSFFRDRLLCSEDVAAVISALASFKGHLPTGSPLSPLMSFFANERMWNRIYALALEKGCCLTVYMDDVGISGSRVTPKLLWEVRKAIHSSGLKYHKEKHYDGSAKELTGVIIRNGQLDLPNRQKLKAHVTRTAIKKAPPDEEKRALVARLKGLRSQATQVLRPPKLD